jgi:hypothetical protein
LLHSKKWKAEKKDEKCLQIQDTKGGAIGGDEGDWNAAASKQASKQESSRTVRRTCATTTVVVVVASDDEQQQQRRNVLPACPFFNRVLMELFMRI